MASKTFHCKLITPAAKVLDEDVTYASIPAWDGYFGVMVDRAPLVAKLGMGELRLDFPGVAHAGGGTRSFVIEDGFVQVVDNKVTILTSRAIPVESIVAAEAEAELREAEARRVPDNAPDREAQSARIAADRRRAELKVRLAGARKGI